ncbi:hypothetical protein NLI96_g4935 [Meripilus lineatus]|uniref:Uncharacterized protein n=1 Tax=Meripilus lineatus TaxID=2056292 RepID=A0AAD5V5V3_9APHY|nr:hypothetical protein NLI96_g4935 [Physisporinus lineatus]
MAPSPTDSFPFYSGPSATLPGITSSQPDNPVGLFIVLLLLAIFFAGGTCVFIWKLYVRGPAYSKRPIRPLVEEDEDSLGKVSPPKQFVLPSLLYSKDFTVLSTSPEKKRRSIFDYLPTMFKRDSRNAILETPSTDKEGEFVLVEAPIPGGDVPSIIVSTCSPSVRKLDIGPSVSSDSLQVPSGRFVAPRPTPPVLLQQPQQPQTPTRPHPLRIIGDYNNRSGYQCSWVQDEGLQLYIGAETRTRTRTGKGQRNKQRFFIWWKGERASEEWRKELENDAESCEVYVRQQLQACIPESIYASSMSSH